MMPTTGFDMRIFISRLRSNEVWNLSKFYLNGNLINEMAKWAVEMSSQLR